MILLAWFGGWFPTVFGAVGISLFIVLVGMWIFWKE